MAYARPEARRRGPRGGLWLALALSCVLALEIAMAFVPRAYAAPGGEIVELCSGTEIVRVTIDPDTGEVLPSASLEGHCPLCVIGMAVAVETPRPLPRDARVARAPALERPRAVAPRIARRGPAIRAPPLTV